MSWEMLSHKIVKARKVHQCDLYEGLNYFDVLSFDSELKTYSVNPEQVKDLQITPEEVEVLNQYIKSGFKIQPGEKYHRSIGKFDGEWCLFTQSLPIRAIVFKYDLYDED